MLGHVCRSLHHSKFALLQNEAVAHAWDMPEGTFGHAYVKFMGDRNFSAGDRPPVRFIDDVELAYVAARAREVHDFWHVLFGCHTNVFGELGLKAVELVQVTPGHISVLQMSFLTPCMVTGTVSVTGCRLLV